MRGWSAILAGTIAAAVGAGIAGPHLAKTGLTPLAIAGAVALLAGVVLVVGGSTILVRARRGWRRFAVVPLVLVFVYVCAWTLVQAVAATNVPHMPMAIAAGSLDSSAEDVTFETRDHVTLSGWFVPSRNGAAVVVAHGAGSTRASVRAHAEVLARHGFGVLAFDARGHGRSEGRAMDFGWYGDEDVGAAVAFVRGRPGVDANRIGAVGLSMGGEEVIGAAATNPGIRAVVAEGATARTRSDKAWLSDEFGARGWLQEQLESVTYGVADLLTAAHPPVSLRHAVATAAPKPVLLITAGKVTDEERAARYIRAGSPGTVEVWSVAGAGHTQGLATRPREWEHRVTAFLESALLTPHDTFTP